jgi:predicted nucleic acid-binding protein
LTYLFDTNVLSELRRPSLAHPSLVAWAGGIALDETFVSVVTVLELERGAAAAMAKDPTHAQRLMAWIAVDVLHRYQSRILSIDILVARRCAQFGTVPDSRLADALIAATALIRDLILVTRNVRDFVPFGVRLLNPWDHPA